MANRVAELYAEFRVSFQKATLDVLNTTLGELRIGTLAEIASLAGLTKMLFNVGSNAIRTATHLHMLGAVYGLNTQKLQNMERAGLAANVSTDKMEASIRGLQDNLAALNLGRVSDSFLQAAGFFGVRVGPGTSEDDLMEQLRKNVPQFIKAHGAMGKDMAAVLLQDMGVSPEMIQSFTKGKKEILGQNITDKNIEKLTKASEMMNVASLNISNLSSNIVAPIVSAIGTASGYLSTIADFYVHAEQLTNPLAAGEAWAKYAMGGMQSLSYISPTEAKAKANEALFNKHYPVQSKFFPPWLSGAGTYSEGKKFDITYKTTVNTYGVEDEKIAKTTARSVRNSHETNTRNFASAINRYNVPEAGQSPKSTP
jgi:uncharacterized coiled-coil protein SlyX